MKARFNRAIRRAKVLRAALACYITGDIKFVRIPGTGTHERTCHRLLSLELKAGRPVLGSYKVTCMCEINRLLQAATRVAKSTNQ